MDVTKTNGAAQKTGGLDGVVVADTRISEVDGERGRLILSGHDVESIAGKATFEDVIGLLRTGTLPSEASAAGRESIRAALGDARARAFARIGDLGTALSAKNGMDALRASIAHVEVDEAREDAATILAGATAVYAAAWSRKAHGEAPIAPDASLSHAADTLRMATGVVDNARSEALDTYLVTVSDHGMNASTFAARVVASTASDTVSSIVAAIGALKGPLHGGAPGPVLDMLDAIGDPARAVAWIEGELAAGRRIMGMGHRIYRVRDPRAAVLEKATLRLEERGVASARLALARAVERAAEGVLAAKYPDRALKANVEFYTAVLLDTVGLSRHMFTPAFAVGRVAGWCAHVEEQRKTGRLIRPSSRYVGPMPKDAILAV